MNRSIADIDIAVEIKRVHAANINWWINIETGEPLQANYGEKIMLAISELSEALEGHRKNLQDDKLPHRKMIEVELADAVIRTFDTFEGFHLPCKEEGVILLHPASHGNVGNMLLEVTGLYWSSYHFYMQNMIQTAADMLLDTIPTIDKIATLLNLDLWGAYEEKMQYNAQRADHKIENRMLANGKKY